MLALLLLLGCRGGADPSAPDVVLVVVDTLRADGLGAYGNPRPVSPSLDALAGEAAWFTRAHAASSWTLPSTVSILTGQYPWQHRVVADVLNQERFGTISPLTRTAAETLRGRGYRTGAFVNNTFLAPDFGFGRGFEVYDYQGASARDYRPAAPVVDAALSWLGQSEQPAFLWVHLFDPHYNYRPPEGCSGRYATDEAFALPLDDHRLGDFLFRELRPGEAEAAFVRAAYDEEVCGVDAALGRLVAALKARPRWERTRLVVTSDHGEEFWEHGRFGHGQSLNSELTHVPLIVREPGLSPRRVDAIIDLTAVHPLLVDGAGPLEELARTGASDDAGMAWSGAPKRAMDQVSVLTDTHRYLVKTESQVGEVWTLDSRGLEDKLESAALSAAQVRAAPWFPLLQQRVADPLTPTLPSVLHQREDVGEEQWQQLRALGYVE